MMDDAYNNLYKSNWGLNINNQPIRQMRYFFSKKLLKKALIKNDVKSVLDIGCGTGEMIRYINEMKPEINTIGIDLSDIAIKIANDTNDKVNNQFIATDFFSFECGTKFDLISVIDVIEHVENDSKFVYKINNCLNQNGLLVISVPNLMAYWTKYDDAGGHFRRYSKRELTNLLQSSGFKVVKIITYGFPIHLVYLLVKNKLFRFEPEQYLKGKSFIWIFISNLLKKIFLINIDLGIGLHMAVIAQKCDGDK